MLPSIFGESLFDDWMGFPFRGFESDVDRKLYGKHARRIRSNCSCRTVI